MKKIKMNNWKKIKSKDMAKIKGGGFWLSIWALSLATVIIGKSIFSDKASVSINGFGRASWENEPPKILKSDKSVTEKAEKDNSLEAFYKKFYEV